MIEITSLEAGYGSIPKVKLDRLFIEKAESFLIRGESGSGKTTLLNTIGGLIRPVGGKIKIGGTDISTLNEADMDRFRGINIGFVFQTLHLVKSLNVMENILLGAYAAGKNQDVSWAETLLDKTGIRDLAHKKADEISQGQAQRAAIARALINKPSLLLADEPTSALDNHSTKNILSLLQSLTDEFGMTLIVTSHDERIVDAFNHTLILGDAT